MRAEALYDSNVYIENNKKKMTVPNLIEECTKNSKDFKKFLTAAMKNQPGTAAYWKATKK